MKLPLRAHLYVWFVVAAAAVFLAYWFRTWRGPLLGDVVGPAPLTLMALLVALAVVAINFVLPVTPRRKLDVSIGVYFASLLLFGPPLAMALVGLSELVGRTTLALRRHPVPGKRMQTTRGVLFNAAQFVIAAGVGGMAYYSLLPHAAPAPLDRPENLWAIPAAAAAMYLANTSIVAVMVGLQLGQNPIDVWLSGRRLSVLQFAGIYLIGFVTAIASATHPWVPVVMVLPAAIIYLSLKRTVELMEQTVAAVEAMADVVDMRDRYTYEHSKRVADYAERLARALRLPADEVETIRLAARVHDLGKIGVPDHVLLKPGKLTDEEWRIMQRHPEIGAQILSRFPQYRRGMELVLAHHERHDGNGYPAGRRDADVPLGGQIIAVADTLDAMTSDRPYRRALPLDRAIEEFRRLKGVQWHPAVVDALEGLVSQASGPRPVTLQATASA